MTPTPGSLHLLLLALLSPEADQHHDAAVAAYSAGDLETSETELRAAYAALPDPRRDSVDREKVLTALRGILLTIHAKTGSPAPLCRLRDALVAHIETLPRDTPPPIEVTSNRERLVGVMGKLTAFPADACAPVAPPVAPSPRPAIAPPPPAVTPSAPVAQPGDSQVRVPEGPTARQLRITGGVLAGLGVALLGVMTYGIVDNQRQSARARAIDASIVGRSITRDELAALQGHRATAKTSQALAIGAGISSAVMSISSIAILVAAGRFKTNTNKTTSRRTPIVTPWQIPAGGGMTLRWALR